jgi:hypothetical protein
MDRTVPGGKEDASLATDKIFPHRIEPGAREGVPDLNALAELGRAESEGVFLPFGEALREGGSVGAVAEGYIKLVVLVCCGDWGADRGAYEEEEGGEGLS